MTRSNTTEHGFCRRRSICGKRGLAIVSSAMICALSASAATIHTKADMRLWQTVPDRSTSLAWPWMEGADSAMLEFSNRVTHTVSAVVVPRGADETRGSCAPPAPQTGEALVDVTLVQTAAGGQEVARETATLAYVSGAGGGPITVRALAAPERELTRLQVPRVYAYDPAWQGEPGDSGYDIAWPMYIGFKIILR